MGRERGEGTPKQLATKSSVEQKKGE